MRRKGQAAIEFYAFVGFFIMIFAVLGLIFMNATSSEINTQKSLMAWETGHRISDAASFALLAGHGFNGTFDIPKDILGSKYDIAFSSGETGTGHVEGGAVYVVVDKLDIGSNVSFSYPINTRDFINSAGAPGTIKLGDLNTSKGYLIIENINQSLKIYQ